MHRFHRVGAIALLLGMAAADVLADYRHPAGGYGRVIHATPIYDRVEVAVPEQQCWQTSDEGPGIGPRGKIIAATLVGGVAGGVIGNQFGGGRGRTALTVAGAVTGAVAGHQIGQQLGGGQPLLLTTTHCETVDRIETREELVGYRVKYRYRGRIFHTRTDSHPGRRIRVEAGSRPIRF